MLDLPSSPTLLASPWLRDVTRVASWWMCATLLQCLWPAASPGNVALAIYLFVLTPLAIVALVQASRAAQAWLGIPGGSPGSAARLLILLEAVAAVELVTFVAPWRA